MREDATSARLVRPIFDIKPGSCCSSRFIAGLRSGFDFPL